ncbi:hypothetical protein AMAG_06614 [Allomyces macrogynus ATCC 38327]|uniref:Uncharacterized protein n=1 Tax=Allomyces macrogynus (strain ATCC 38327) TaxID=578462 RepID=A0A0L0SE85_ALLM3|nr:hypothetical protein AMAG_06614 [Allomyces macrogynus ATCC 38327]|eukprot:KNE60848.1 hypothetical protein AMAG_06614 [Allomyces macrogynus ATCC 38327]
MSALHLDHGHGEPHAAPMLAELGPLPTSGLAQAAHEQFYATVRHAVLVLVFIVAAVPVAHRLLRPPPRKRPAVRTRLRSDPVPSSLLPLCPRHGAQDDDDDALASLWMRLDADTPVVTPPDHSRATSSNSLFALPNHFDSHFDTLILPPAPPSSRSTTACTLPVPLPRSRTSTSAAGPRAAGPHHLHSLWHQFVASAWTVVAPRMFPLARARSVSSTSSIDLAAAAPTPPPPPAPAALQSKPPPGGLLPSSPDHGDNDATELWRTLLAPHPAREWLPTTWSLSAAMDDRLFLSRHWSIPSVLVVLCLAVLLAAPPLTIVAVALPDAAADMRLAVESLTLACAVLVLPFAYLYAEAGTPIEYELESAGAAHMMALLRPLAPLSETLSQLVPPAPIPTARHVKARVIETALTLVAVYLLASLLLYVVPPTTVALIAQVAAHVIAVTVAIPHGMALHTSAITAWLTPRGFAAQVDAAVQVVRMQLLALPTDDDEEADRIPRPRSAIAAPITADQFFAAAAAAARSTARPTSEPDVLAAFRRPRPRTLSLDARHTTAPVSVAARRAALRAREKALRDVARVRSPARSNAVFAVLATGYAAATACLAVAPWVDAGVAVRTVAAALVVAQIVTAAIASAKAPKSVAGLLGNVAVGLLAAAALPGILDTLVGGGVPLAVPKAVIEGSDPGAWPWEVCLWAGWVEMFGPKLEPVPVAVAATADVETAMPLVEYAHVACLVVLWARCAVALRRALGSTATQLRAGKTTPGGRKARDGGL